jgi:hypothetical protein
MPSIALALVVAACTSLPNAPGTMGLPTIDTRAFSGCRGVATEAVLAGDPGDSRVAWLLEAGKRVDVVFPYGFSARFTPGLEVLNASGAVVARGGDRIEGGCVTDGPLLILFP